MNNPWHLSLGDVYGSHGPLENIIFLFGSAIRNRCWIADQLARRGLSHPERCPLCDQEEETIQHLLTNCVFSRQIWFIILSPMEMDEAVPQQNEHSFAAWWAKCTRRVKEYKKGVNSLIILTSWLIWKHRNSCVFDGATPSINEVLRQFRDEYKLWCLAGAKKLQALWLDGVGTSGRCLYLVVGRQMPHRW